MIAWTIPLVIIALIVYTSMPNASAGMQRAVSWIVWNGSLSALGTAIAFGHPLAILTTFIVAPITSLNPLIAAGWFAGIVQAYIRKPNVADFESLSEDVLSFKGFWNKIGR